MTTLTCPTRTLPPGQHAYPWRPFGKPRYAGRTVTPSEPLDITITGAVATPRVFTWDELSAGLATTAQTSDLHCVMTWSAVGIRWEGVQFADLYDRLVDWVAPSADAHWVVVHSLDGYQTCLSLDDALSDDVLIASRRDRFTLDIEHGGPLRLVSPSQYGYKNAKHVSGLEFTTHYVGGPQAWMAHPRGRVAREERSSYLPGRVYRPVWGALREWAWRAYDTEGAARRETS